MKEELNQAYWREKGVVKLIGEINTLSASRAVEELVYLADRGFLTITMWLDSPGGSVPEGFWIHDTIKLLEKKGITVRGICCGMCASMAAFILASCTIRETTSNSEIMIHQPLGGMQGQASDMRIAWKHMQRTKTRYEELFAKYTGKTVNEIQIATDRDNFMNAEEAMRFGIVDGILENLDEYFGD